MQKNAEDVKALPLISRLIPSITNTGKLVAVNTLIRSICQLFEGVPVRLLVDSWYMRKTLILSSLKRGFHVIGQVRIDTCLHDEPVTKKLGQRGRPRKYGDKYTSKRIAHLKKTETTLTLYGKRQPIRYRSKILMARFLEGRLVRVVWSEIQKANGSQLVYCSVLIHR